MRREGKGVRRVEVMREGVRREGVRGSKLGVRGKGEGMGVRGKG